MAYLLPITCFSPCLTYDQLVSLSLFLSLFIHPPFPLIGSILMSHPITPSHSSPLPLPLPPISLLRSYLNRSLSFSSSSSPLKPHRSLLFPLSPSFPLFSNSGSFLHLFLILI